ncbi:MAG: RHS repeat protein [Lentisphaerae bacterium]|nr:RHS repeat protein [Lentisphaerota bacterium]
MNLTTGQYEAEVEDLRVKVLGGAIRWKRCWRDRAWAFNPDWRELEFVYALDGSIDEIVKNGVVYERADPVGTVYIARDEYRIRREGSNYVWHGPGGRWRRYDAAGRQHEYGDRNAVRVFLVYSNGLLTGACDHFSNRVLRIGYSGGSPPRVAFAACPAGVARYTYDAGGRLSAATDVLGHTTAYGYREDGRLARVLRPGGRETSFAYDHNAYIASVTGADGSTRRFAYSYDDTRRQYYGRVTTAGGRVTEKWFDANGTLIRSALNGRTTYDAAEPESAAAEPVAYTYNDAGDVTRAAAPGGRVTLYRYDERGNLTNRVEAAGTDAARITAYDYDRFGQCVRETRPAPLDPVCYRYDDFGNRTSISSGVSVVRYTHDARGNVVTTADARGFTWSTAYDAAGRRIAACGPCGPIESNVYDAAGNRVRTENAAGVWTVLAYDGAGREILNSNALGVVVERSYGADGDPLETRWSDKGALVQMVRYAFDMDGRLIRETVSRGGDAPRVTAYDYDADGRLVRTTDPDGNVTELVYDPESGRIVRETGPALTRRYAYDDAGQLIESTVFGAGVTGAVQYAWDAAGNLVRRTDALGRETRAAYDALDRPVRVVDALGGTNRLAYDAAGHVTAITDANGTVTEFAYDGAGNVVEKRIAGERAAAYAYDAGQYLAQSEDGKGQAARYACDAAGRLTAVAWAHSATGAPVREAVLTYDGAGRLAAYADGAVSASLAYDDINRMQTVTVDFGPFSRCYTYAFDAFGRKTAFAVHADPADPGDMVHYAYDAAGRFSGATLPGEGTITWARDALARVASAHLPGGTLETRAYDGLGRLVTNTVRTVDGAALRTRVYVRDGAGNVVACGAETGGRAYAYDAADRLVREWGEAAGGAMERRYVYDAAGNRTRVIDDGAVTNVYGVNALNQYTAVSSGTAVVRWDYDANGSALVHYRFPAGGGVVTNRLTWNTANRLSGVSNGAGRAEYAYDVFGRRVRKAVYSDAGSETNFYLYADEGLVAEFDAAGHTVRAYGYAPDAVWMNDPLWVREGRVGYCLNDHLGTPHQLVDSEGRVIWSMTPDAFGRTAVDPAGSFCNPLRFSGQYYDLESGLHYNTFRFYDPHTGRYLSRDPLGEGETYFALLHGYAFCENCPLVLTDHDGRLPKRTPYVPFPQPLKGVPRFPKQGFWMCKEELFWEKAFWMFHHRFIVVDGIGIGYEKAPGSRLWGDPGGMRIENDLKPRKDVQCFQLTCLEKDCTLTLLGELMNDSEEAAYKLGYRDCQSWANNFAHKAYVTCDDQCCKEKRPWRTYFKRTGW